MRFLIAAFCLVYLAACGGAPVSAEADSRGNGGEVAQRFDPLTMRLELEATSVKSGGKIESTLVVENRSGDTITDPGCVIGAGRYALVPVADPTAELWLAPVVDCEGPFAMPDGFDESYAGPTFPAATMFGDPLPPGSYIASLEIDGRSDRLEQPVSVTE